MTLPAVSVDETAALEEAAAKIVLSKTFDHATSCSSENSLVVVEAVGDAMLAALARHGCVMLDGAARERLRLAMWPDGRLSAAVIGQPAGRIAFAGGEPPVVGLSWYSFRDESPSSRSAPAMTDQSVT